MKPITVTAQDILDFARSASRPVRENRTRPELLVLEDGQIAYLDYGLVASGSIETGARIAVLGQGEATILLDRSEIFGGRFGDHASDPLTEQDAATVADTINRECGLATAAAICDAHEMGEAAERDAKQAQASALKRAQAVVAVVGLCGGNQSEAARRLGLDQSTVNKLVQKARAAGSTAA